MGFLSDFFDDTLGFDPGGGGIFGVARDILGDKIADDILGLDPSGGGIVKIVNAAAPLIAAYYGAGYLSNALNAGVTDPSALAAAADADMAAGMLPEYGTNAAYDSAMADLMAGSPGAVDQLQNVVNGPAVDTSVSDIYSNEGANYGTTASTQGAGGSPVNASTASSGLTLNNVLNAARLASLAAGAVSAATPEDSSGFGIVPVPADWKTPEYQKYSPTLVELKGVDPMANLLAGTQFDPLAQMTLLPTSIASPNLDYIRGLLGQTNAGSVGQ